MNYYTADHNIFSIASIDGKNFYWEKKFEELIGQQDSLLSNIMLMSNLRSEWHVNNKKKIGKIDECGNNEG